MSSGERIEQIRAKINLTQAEWCARLGVALRTYTHYVGGRDPSAEVLTAISRMGFNANWVLTGEGSMRLDEAAQAPIPVGSGTEVDTVLYGRVLEQVSAVYREFGFNVPLHQVGTKAAEIAAEIASPDLVTVDDKAAAARVAAAMLRRELRAASADPSSAASGKHSA